MLLNPLVRMMQPKRTSRYPQPPPSLVIKPSASNSPSRVHTRVNRLTTSTSTPERMKVRAHVISSSNFSAVRIATHPVRGASLLAVAEPSHTMLLPLEA